MTSLEASNTTNPSSTFQEDIIRFGPGRYKVCLVTRNDVGIEYPPTEGEIELVRAPPPPAADRSGNKISNNRVVGSLTEGPIMEGTWSANDDDDDDDVEVVDDLAKIRLVILYNGALPHEYILYPFERRGTWKLLSSSSLSSSVLIRPDEQGDLDIIHWECLESAEERAQKDIQRLGSVPVDGNHACRVQHITSIPVPCAACGSDEHGRLAFFTLTVPHFGSADLVSFSCTACHYKQTRLQMTQPANDHGGTTLTIHVRHAHQLDGTVILTDSSTIHCPELDLELSNGTGRYTTVEGVLRGCTTVLKGAGIVTDDDPVEKEVDTNHYSNNNSVDDFIDRVDQLLQTCRASKPRRTALQHDKDEDEPSQSSSCAPVLFSLRIVDPLGLAYMEGADEVTTWTRTPEQDAELGLLDSRSTTIATSTLTTDPSTMAATKSLPDEEEAQRTTPSVLDTAMSSAQLSSSSSSGTTAAVVAATSSTASSETLMKACEAIAAEYTKEYEPSKYEREATDTTRQNSFDDHDDDDDSGILEGGGMDDCD